MSEQSPANATPATTVVLRSAEPNAGISIWLPGTDTRIPHTASTLHEHDFQRVIRIRQLGNLLRIAVVLVPEHVQNLNYTALVAMCGQAVVDRLYGLLDGPTKKFELTPQETDYIIGQIALDMSPAQLETTEEDGTRQAIITLYNFRLGPLSGEEARQTYHFLSAVEVWWDGHNTYIRLPSSTAGQLLWDFTAVLIGAELAARARAALESTGIHDLGLSHQQRSHICNLLTAGWLGQPHNQPAHDFSRVGTEA